MKAVVQRVSRAEVRVDGQIIGRIDRGLLVLLGIGQGDTDADSDWMINKLLNLRIFPDDAGKMNRSVTDIAGGILVVSQFTLYGDARKGTRPSFSDAMPPADAAAFYERFMRQLRAATALSVAEGKFAAMMAVDLVNDGPVTIILDSNVARASRPSSPDVARASRPSGPCPPSADQAPGLLFMPFDPSAPMEIRQRGLPHWEQAGCTYFLTFRLADSLPRQKLDLWFTERERWIAQYPTPHSIAEKAEYQQLFPDRLQQWLDAGEGECWLRRPAVATVVEQALRHFEGDRYGLGEFVIMPNHVHALITPLANHDLPSILHSWKSYTAHEINRQLGRTGKIWQDEYFDHLVRQERSLEQFAAYIRENPNVAGLREGEYRVAGASGASPPPFISQRDDLTAEPDGRDARATDTGTAVPPEECRGSEPDGRDARATDR